jgi:hypothetical protein
MKCKCVKNSHNNSNFNLEHIYKVEENIGI